jgi:hypothetical protein
MFPAPVADPSGAYWVSSAPASGGSLIKRLINALRHRLRRSRPRVHVTDGMLRQFVAACQDLADDDVMATAWR